ncbi:complement component receptor 1-like protein isoform 8-T10 [Macrochelys suwanniensis]
MVSAPRCRPGAWGLLTLLLLLPLPGARGICESPPRLSFAELAGVVNNSYPVGTKLKYSCRPGYILSSGKSPFVTCLPNSSWSVDPEFCVGRPCKALELESGRVDATDLQFGATANFSCSEGYRLIGPTSAQCVVVGNGVDWDKELPLCQAIPCLPPPNITHGSHNGQSGQEFSFGSAVTYKCDQGFSLIGEASVHCTTKDHVNGEWSGPAPECKGQCGAPPRLRRAVPRVTNRTEGFPINTEVTYKCLDCCVKIPGKSDTVVCLSNSEWSTIGECCDASCGAPPRLKSAALNKEDEMKNYHPSGTTVSYVCRPGYERTELRPVMTCLENLTWSEAPEFCRGKSCGVPKGPEHGRAVDVTNDLYGAKVNIICDDGFRLRGRTFIQCLLKGDQVEWSPLPTCQEITCSPPPNVTNGMHNGSNMESFDYNSSVTYKCDHNFSLTGEASIRCTTKDNIKGVWNGSAPECKVILTQDKPTTVPPEGAEVAGTSSGSVLSTTGKSAEPEGEVIITQDKPTTVPPKGAEVAGTSSGPGIDTHIIIGIIGIIIGIGIGIGISKGRSIAISMGKSIAIGIGICIGNKKWQKEKALNKKWQKKKGSYNVNPDSTEHDFQMNGTKSNFIFKV